MPASSDDNTTRIQWTLPAAEVKALKVLAVQNGRSFAAELTAAIRAHLAAAALQGKGL